MTSMDVTDLADTLYSTIGKLTRRQISGPIYVTRGGEQVAVIIRSQAYAPKLDNFGQNGDGWMTCSLCAPDGAVIGPRPLDLGDAVRTANEHWSTRHQEQK